MEVGVEDAAPAVIIVARVITVVGWYWPFSKEVVHVGVVEPPLTPLVGCVPVLLPCSVGCRRLGKDVLHAKERLDLHVYTWKWRRCCHSACGDSGGRITGIHATMRL